MRYLSIVLLLLFTGLVIHKPHYFGMFSFAYVVEVHNVLGFILLINAALALAGLLSAEGAWLGRALNVFALLGGVGLILFVQNLFGYYESWAYVWALIPFFVGAGMMLAADEEEGEHGTEAARHLMTWSMTAFVIFAAVFELFIFDGGVFAAAEGEEALHDAVN